MKLVPDPLILRPKSAKIENLYNLSESQKEWPKLIYCANHYLEMTFGAN